MWPVRSIALFLLKLALLVPLLFWTWGFVQPSYSGLVTTLADGVMRLQEWDVRVTHLALTPSGDTIEIRTPLREDGEPANRYEARTLHFYLVPALAVTLAFPGLGWRRRLLAFGIALGLVAIFQTIALVVTIEHTYAVILSEIARRNYSPAEQKLYTWLYEAFAFIAIQGVPAAVVICLVAWYGPLGRGRAAAGPSGDEDDAHPGPATTDAAAHLAMHDEKESSRADTVPEHRLGVVAPGVGVREAAAPARSSARQAFRIAAAVLLALGGTTLVFGAWMHRGKVMRRKAETLCVWGHRALGKNDIEKAQEFLARSVRLNPAFYDAHSGLGAALLQSGDAAGAAGAYSEAIRLNPAVGHSQAGLGESLARSGDFAGAARAFTEAIRLDPSVSLWHGQLATALVMAGRQPEAEKAFRNAIERWPEEPSLRLNLSILLTRAGRLCEAVPHLEAFLDIAPGDPDAGLVRQSLDFAEPRCPAATPARP